jgi:hypothetical protein
MRDEGGMRDEGVRDEGVMDETVVVFPSRRRGNSTMRDMFLSSEARELDDAKRDMNDER